MHKLLRAHFARLKKDKIFLASAVLMFALGVLLPFNQYRNYTVYGYTTAPDNIFFGYAQFIGVLSAVFCSLFLGREYSDGVIRNKLAVGHGRTSVYLSGLAVCIAEAFLVSASYMVSSAVAGVLLLGPFQAPPAMLLLYLLESFLMIAALCSLFTLHTMLNQYRAAASVVNTVGIFVLIFLAVYVVTALDAPEFHDNYVFMDSLGNLSSERIPNPNYLTGTARAVYEFFLDFLPTGQALQFTGMRVAYLWRLPLCSLFLIAASTGAGLTAFSRKNIK